MELRDGKELLTDASAQTSWATVLKPQQLRLRQSVLSLDDEMPFTELRLPEWPLVDKEPRPPSDDLFQSLIR
jgi:hypothetical protein